MTAIVKIVIVDKIHCGQTIVDEVVCRRISVLLAGQPVGVNGL